MINQDSAQQAVISAQLRSVKKTMLDTFGNVVDVEATKANVTVNPGEHEKRVVEAAAQAAAAAEVPAPVPVTPPVAATITAVIVPPVAPAAPAAPIAPAA